MARLGTAAVVNSRRIELLELAPRPQMPASEGGHAWRIVFAEQTWDSATMA